MNMAWNRASPFICEQWRCFCNGNLFQIRIGESIFGVKANLDEVCTAFDWLLKHEERVHIIL